MVQTVDDTTFLCKISEINNISKNFEDKIHLIEQQIKRCLFEICKRTEKGRDAQKHGDVIKLSINFRFRNSNRLKFVIRKTVERCFEQVGSQFLLGIAS